MASSTKVTFKLGTATMNFSGSSFSGDAQSSASGQPICMRISPPTLSGGTLSSSGSTFPLTCTANNTNGAWILCLSSGGAASLTIPRGGVVCKATALGQTCTMIYAPAGSAEIFGGWANAPVFSFGISGQIPVDATGGFPCPSDASGSLTVTYATSPALTITPN